MKPHATHTQVNTSTRSIEVSTPGRVCLFGEHQDYLHLPVVPCAISLRIAIAAEQIPDYRVMLELPDIGSHEEFSLEGTLAYGAERDYFRAAVNVIRRHGFTFSRGIHGRVHSTIPINSGTSSSSALIVTWIDILARLSDQAKELPPADLARFANQAEVGEFGEPGGMMDHYSTAYGGVLAIDFSPELHVEPLDAELGSFVVGDSGEPKDTRGILARVKYGVLAAEKRLASIRPGFTLLTATDEDIDSMASHLTEADVKLLHGTIDNHRLTGEARCVLAARPLDHRRLGALLTEHQAVLRDVQRISTPKIDRMIKAALAAGAYGAKINGSGGGGCMFAYAPDQPEKVARAIEHAGGKAYIVRPDQGTRLEKGASAQ